MKKFMVIYHAPDNLMAQTDKASPEEMKKGLEANSIEEAKGMLEGHPHLAWDGACEIEVHEALPPPGSETT